MKLFGKIIKGVVGLFVVLVVLGALVGNDRHPSTVAASAAGGTAATAPQTPLPPAESALIAAAERGTAAYDAGGNDMAKGASRPNRAKEICAAIPALVAHDWLGTVEALSSNGDGKGVLTLRLAPTVTVATWNNSLSDFQDHTMIEPGTPLFNAAVAMKVGDHVRFSGSFMRSSTDCAEEHSITLEGSMEEPEFIFRFTALQSEE